MDVSRALDFLEKYAEPDAQPAARQIVRELRQHLNQLAERLEGPRRAPERVDVDKAERAFDILLRDGFVSPDRRPPPLIAEDRVKEIATDFFRWWYNQPGANTDQGFDDWWGIHKTRFLQKGGTHVPIE